MGCFWYVCVYLFGNNLGLFLGEVEEILRIWSSFRFVFWVANSILGHLPSACLTQKMRYIYIYRHVILVAIPKIQSLTSQLVCYGLLVYDIRKCSTKHQQNPSIVFFALGLRQSSVRVKRSTKQGFEFCGSMITLPPGSNQSGSHPGNIVLRGKKLGKIPGSWFPKLLGTMKQGFMSSI